MLHIVKLMLVVFAITVLNKNKVFGGTLPKASRNDSNDINTNGAYASGNNQIIGRMINDTESQSKEEIVREWFKEVEKQDNRGIRPTGKTVEISVAITLSNIRAISEGDMTYSLDFFFSESWTDPRLTFNATIHEHAEETLEQSSLERIWTPDTYFINAIRIASVSSDSMSHKHGIRVDSFGRITLSRRISGKFECAMDLVMYPFDYQKCLIKISSYMHEDTVTRYRWSKQGRALVLESMDKLPNFNLYHHSKVARTLDYGTRKYSSLEICFLFSRNAGFCYMQLLIPAASVVLCSWLSLWLENHTQINDLLTAILAIIFLSYSYNSMMPRVSYVKAMDIYLLACFAFVFLSLAKLIIVKYLKSRAEEKEKDFMAVNTMKVEQEHVVDTEEQPLSSGGKKHLYRFQEIARRARTELTQKDIKKMRGKLLCCFKAVQVGSQIILPLLFGGFCVFFFLIYPISVSKPTCT